MDLHDATLVVGIPSVGLVGPIAASYLLDQCGLDQVCALESPDFPPMSMVYAGKPKYPVRIYASTERRLAVVLAEFAPEPELARPIACTLLDWAQPRGIARIVALEGFTVVSVAGPRGEARDAAEVPVAGLATSDAGRRRVRTAGIASFEQGMVTGVAGVLLNEGVWRRLDVMALLGASAPDVPDARSAAAVLAALAQLLPKLPLDPAPLHEAARREEERVRAAREQAQPALPMRPGAAPVRLAADPVCGMLIDPATAAGTVGFEDRTYYLCSERCLRRFRADPRSILAHPEVA